ncbi:hypothetical protein F8S13_01900 [Chloroflexia bacterium SDU3-3]|nr:hypothetical protein F8S13_01900 [Chloroflexia bacterium SDU3-3]
MAALADKRRGERAAEAYRPEVELRPAPRVPQHWEWGWLPPLTLAMACGMLLIGYAFAQARAGAAWAELGFWGGLLLIVLPTALRLMSAGASRRERLGLVVTMGLAIYAVKVMHNPLAFTFPDELTHYRNVEEALASGHLFAPNPGVEATARYPGLPILAAALVQLGGLSIFQAGLALIGVARAVALAALFLLHERVSGSARIAGIASLIYIGNSNFVFWSAQYAYESLALPMGCLVLFLVARREREYDAGVRGGLTVAAAMVILLVVVTHHMTTAALLVFLWAACVAVFALSGRRRAGPLDLAVYATGLGVAWLLTVSPVTVGYLSPVLGGAIRSGFEFATGQRGGRQLFQSTSTSTVAPLWERVTGLGSVAVIVLALPFGLVRFWREYRDHAYAWLLALAALGYFPVLGLRLTAAGWETSNRASTFMFIGVSMIVALALAQLTLVRRWRWPIRAACAAYVGVVFFGGVIAGWAPRVRMAQPYAVGEQMVEPQGLLAAEWLRGSFGADNRVAVDPANAKYMLSYGEQTPLTRTKNGIKAMLTSDNVGRTERSIIRKSDVRFVVMDRREVSWDHVAGLYYERAGVQSLTPLYLSDAVFTKFAYEEFVDRLYDSGTVVIYDVGVYEHVPEAPR